MPDMSMCMNKKCPSSNICYRFMAKPDSYQSYGMYKPEPDTEQCNDFWPIERKKDDTKSNKRPSKTRR